MSDSASSSSKIDRLVSDVADLKASQRYLVQAVDEIKRTSYVSKSDYTDDLSALRDDLKSHAASIKALDDRTRNTPTVERIVFGLAGLILTAVFLALVALVISRGTS